MKLILSLITLLLFVYFSLASAPLTVAAILKAPYTQGVAQALMRNGSNASQVTQIIEQCTQAILEGNKQLLQQLVAEHAQQGCPQSCGEKNTLRSLIKQFVCKQLPKTGTALATGLPASYHPFIKQAMNTVTTTHAHLLQQKYSESHDEALLRKPLVSAAHAFAVDKVINLILTLYSPKAHPCDRMEALLLVNHVHLLGIKKRLFTDFIARSNRHCFTSDGLLKQYDPSSSHSSEPKRVKELIKFLRGICDTQKQYRDYLKLGISQGITQLMDELEDGHIKKPTKISSFRNYATGITKGLASGIATGIATGIFALSAPGIISSIATRIATGIAGATAPGIPLGMTSTIARAIATSGGTMSGTTGGARGVVTAIAKNIVHGISSGIARKGVAGITELVPLLSSRSVPPTLIRSRTITRLFMQLITLCEESNLQDPAIIEQIRMLVYPGANVERTILKQYFIDAQARLRLH